MHALSGSLVFVAALAMQAPPARQPAAPAARPAVAAPGITNADVVKLVKAGFSDETIVADIRQAKRRAFRLDADSLIALKTAGVSEQVIQVMIHPDAPPVPAAQPAQPVAPPSPPSPPPAAPPAPVADAPAVPDEFANLAPGIYFAPNAARVQPVVLEPSVFANAGGSFWKPGSKSRFTARIAAPSARLRIPSGQATFYFVFGRGAAGTADPGSFAGWLAAAAGAGDFVLMPLTRKTDRRELELTNAQSRDALPTQIEKLAPGVYRVKTAGPLQGGEYCFFYAAGLPAYTDRTVGKLFDFSVDPITSTR
jgi:hypothetical protein